MAVDGLALSFIALEDFKTNKLAVGRHQDLADLETLTQNPGGKTRAGPY